MFSAASRLEPLTKILQILQLVMYTLFSNPAGGQTALCRHVGKIGCLQFGVSLYQTAILNSQQPKK